LLTALAIWTNLNRNLDEEGNKILENTGKYWKSEDEGAATMLVAAFDPLLRGNKLVTINISC